MDYEISDVFLRGTVKSVARKRYRRSTPGEAKGITGGWNLIINIWTRFHENLKQIIFEISSRSLYMEINSNKLVANNYFRLTIIKLTFRYVQT